MEWIDLKTAGEKGSEDGEIIIDEEYRGSCRITLEKCKDRFAITCGVYGDMVHTAFCTEEDSNDKYESMKECLKKFIDKIIEENTSLDDRADFYDWFINKFF